MKYTLKLLIIFILAFLGTQNISAFNIDVAKKKFNKEKNNVSIKKNTSNFSSEFNFAVTGDPEAKTSVSFSQVINPYGQDETITSYYKKNGNNWYHYRNKIDDGDKVVTVDLYMDAKKCKTTISKFSCSNGLVSKYVEYVNDVDDSHSKIIFYYPNIKTQNFKKANYYDKKNRLEYSDVQKLNGSGKVISSVSYEREYYSNNKLKNIYVYKYKGEVDGKFAGQYSKHYNKLGKLTHYLKYASNDVVIHYEKRKYYNNKKIKSIKILKNNKNEIDTASYYTVYKNNGKRNFHKRLYYKRGEVKKILYVKYNKKGQKKSNKYGNAYKYITYIKYGNITKVTKAKYSKKGKLSKAKKIKASKATSRF